MSKGQNNLLSQMETTSGTLLYELQIIWDEVGESDTERDKMLLEIEQECLEVYRRKVDQANRFRAQLRQAIADAEAELAAICSAMGERPVHIRQSDQNPESLNSELRAILPQIEEMRKRKSDRKNQFIEVLDEIQSINNEIYRSSEFVSNNPTMDENDLSIRKLEELHKELKALQAEKSERLKLILEHMNSLYSLCIVLGLDFKTTVIEIHTSLGEAEGSKDISNGTIEQLGNAIQKLRELKIQRMQQLQDLTTSLLELWNLMDTPIEEQQIFHKVTCNLAASEDEISEPDMLSVDFINYVRVEVSRLEALKTSKMKELVIKKKAELGDICRKAHLIPEADTAMEIAIDAMESGAVDAGCVLEEIELQIGRVKEEALSRIEILEKVEKWMAACEEESWLEEYNMDNNRYNAGRGTHLALKRAEKARALINKLPVMVDTLASKTIAWENEKGLDFTYDGVRLLSMLEDYTVQRQEKELEQKRQRDMKKLQGQLQTEQEAIYGSKPSPMKNHNVKKGGSRVSCGNNASNRRLSLGGPMLQLQTPKPDIPPPAKATPNTRKRGLDISVLPVKLETPTTRKPFSPISSTDSSKSNLPNIFEDPNNKLQKTLTISNTNPYTPKTVYSAIEEENRTPQAMAIINVPSTPSTVSISMQTAITPAAKPTAVVPFICTTKPVEEEIEYSFEERRAGFVHPGSHLVAVIQV